MRTRSLLLSAAFFLLALTSFGQSTQSKWFSRWKPGQDLGPKSSAVITNVNSGTRTLTIANAAADGFQIGDIAFACDASGTPISPTVWGTINAVTSTTVTFSGWSTPSFVTGQYIKRQMRFSPRSKHPITAVNAGTQTLTIANTDLEGYLVGDVVFACDVNGVRIPSVAASILAMDATTVTLWSWPSTPFAVGQYLMIQASWDWDSVVAPLGPRQWSVFALDYQGGVDLSDRYDDLSGPGQWLSNAFSTFVSAGYHAGFVPSPSTPEPWYLRYTACRYPIAAFGTSAESPPLYVGRTYRFAFAAGIQSLYTDEAEELVIKIYDKSTGNYVDQDVQELAHTPASAAGGAAGPWEAFGSGGFQKTISTKVGGVEVLKTTIQYVNRPVNWHQWGQSTPLFVDAETYPLFITHCAKDSQYAFVVGLKSTIMNGDNNLWYWNRDSFATTNEPYGYAYAMHFDDPPPWATTLIQTPHFDGKPLPSFYTGKTVEEIMQTASPLPDGYGDLFEGIRWTKLSRDSTGAATATSSGGGTAGTELTKVTAAVAWDASARSEKVLRKDGAIQVRFKAAAAAAVGLDPVGGNGDRLRLDYALISASNQITPYANGVAAGAAAAYVESDVFTLERYGTSVRALKNGEPIVVFAALSSGPLYAGAMSSTQGAVLLGCRHRGAVLADSDLDGMDDEWEEQLVEHDEDDDITTIAQVQPGEDFDGDGISNVQEYLDGSDGTVPATVLTSVETVAWKDFRNAASDGETLSSGSQLAKTGATASYDADAVSTKRILKDGRVRFRIGSANINAALGLTRTNPSASPSTIDFALQAQTDGTIRVVESGSVISNTTVRYDADDVLEIERNGWIVRYKVNGDVIYTSTVRIHAPLMVDTSLYAIGNSVKYVRFVTGDADQDGMDDAWELAQLPEGSGLTEVTAFTTAGDSDSDGRTNLQEYQEGTNPNNSRSKTEAVVWTALANATIQGTNGGLRKTAGAASTYDAGGAGQKKLIGNYGRIVFQGTPGNWAMVGLSPYHNNNNPSKFCNAIRLVSSTVVEIWEFNTIKATFSGVWTASTFFEIRRTASTVGYFADGVLLYQSLLPTSGPMHASAIFANLNSEIASCRLETGDADNDGLDDEWELEHFPPGVGVTELAAITAVTTTADVDGDGRDNLAEYREGTTPTDPLSVTEPVVWIKHVGTASQGTDGGLVRTVPETFFWDAGAISTQTIEGDGSVVASNVAAGHEFAVGLNGISLNANINDIPHAISISGNGMAVMESGSLKAGTTSDAANPIFELRRTGTTVRYFADGALVYTSLIPSTGPVFVDSSCRKVNSALISCRVQTRRSDTDGDGMADGWELTHLPPGSDMTDVLAYAAGSDADGDGVSNLQEFIDGTDPNSDVSRAETVTWTGHVNTTTQGTAGGLKKTAGVNGTYDADAVGTKRIVGDGKVVFKGVPWGLAVGLNGTNANRNYTELDYCFVLLNTNVMRIYEAGVQKFTATSWGNSDPSSIFEIRRTGSTVRYFVNGVQIYVSATPCHGELLVDTAFSATNSEISWCRVETGDVDEDGLNDTWELAQLGAGATFADLQAFSGGSADQDSDGVTDFQEYLDGTDPANALSRAEAVVWTSHVNTTTQGSAGGLQKTGGTNGVHDADAVGTKKIVGDGRVVFKRAALGGGIAVGLNPTNADRTYTELDHAILLTSTRSIQVYEQGALKSTWGSPWTTNSVLEIRRETGVVRYFADGDLIYESVNKSYGSVLVDTSFSNTSDELTWCRIETGDLDQDTLPDVWELAHLAGGAGLTELTAFTAGGDQDGDGATNLREYLDGTDPTRAVSKTELASWTSLVNTTVDGSDGGLKKTGGSNGSYNADAITTKKLIGNGRLVFKPGTVAGGLTVGLNLLNSSSADYDIEHRFLALGNGTLQVYEGSTLRTTVQGGWTANTVLAIVRTGTQVTYWADGVLVYTSFVKSFGPVFVDASFRDVNDTLASCHLFTGDIDNDGMNDEWELAHFPPGVGVTESTALAAVTDAGDADLDFVTNLQEYLDQTNPANAGSRTEIVTWTSKVNTGTPAGNTDGGLKKTAGVAGYNADGISTKTIARDGKLVFKAFPGFDVAAGFNATNASRSYTELDHAIHPNSAQSMVVFESGSFMHSAAPWGADTIFEIRRTGTQVTYHVNGGLFYTSTIPSSGPVFVDTSFYALSSELTSCRIDTGDLDGDGMDDVWELANFPPGPGVNVTTALAAVDPAGHSDSDNATNLQEFQDGTNPSDGASGILNVVWKDFRNTGNPTATGGLTRTAQTSLWDGDAVSTKVIPTDGMVRIKFGTLARRSVVGLSSNNSSATEKDVDYGIDARADNTIYVMEGGVQKAGPFAPARTLTDVFEVRRQGTTVTYWRNGALLYTSTIPSLGPVMVDAAMFTTAAALTECRMSGASDPTIQPVQEASTSTTDLLTLDNAPEVRTHPLLDSLVEDLDRNPMALANFVLNEIQLTDALAYYENGAVNTAAVNDGGVNRSALGVYLERQGSPKEQCALLVYLLRRAGYPAMYAFPKTGGMKLLDSTLSKLLRMQIVGALKSDGTSAVPHEVPVDYPWVIAYIEGKWVNLFPWLKDTELVEGRDVWEHIPEVPGGANEAEHAALQVDSPRRWVRSYLLLKPAAFDSLAVDESPLETFIRRFEGQLNETESGLGISDFGYRATDRKHYHATWDAFPRPWLVDANMIADLTTRLQDHWGARTAGAITQVTTPVAGTRNLFFPNAGTSGYAIGDVVNGCDADGNPILNARGTVTNVTATYITVGTLPAAPAFAVGQYLERQAGGRMFDTVTFTLKRTTAGTPTIGTVGPLRLIDLHNRRAVLTSNGTTITLKLQAYRPELTGVTAGNFANDPDLLKPQTVTYTNSDAKFTLTTATSVHRFAVHPAAATETFLGIQELGDTRTMTVKRWDLNAWCWNAGRVTPEMLQVHAEESWNLNQQTSTPATNLAMAEIIAYTMGMSYHQRLAESWRDSTQLFKLANVSVRSFGFGTIGDKLMNGTHYWTYPVIDMAYFQSAYVVGHDLKLDSGGRSKKIANEFPSFLTTEMSAMEHVTINRFFPQEKAIAISTVKLLHLAQEESRPIVELQASNYVAQGNVNYTVNGVTKTLSVWAGSALAGATPWSAITSAFTANDKEFTTAYITPGEVNSEERTIYSKAITAVNSTTRKIDVPDATAQFKMGDVIFGSDATGDFTDPAVTATVSAVTASPSQITVDVWPTSHPFVVGGILKKSFKDWKGMGVLIFSEEGGSALITQELILNGGLFASDALRNPSLSSSGVLTFGGDNHVVFNSVTTSTNLPTYAFSTPVHAASITYQSLTLGTSTLTITDMGAANFYNQVYWNNSLPNLEGMRTTMDQGGVLVLNFPNFLVSDPVNALTGHLYVDEVDMTLPGALPLSVRRNYSSGNVFDNGFGHGWMSSLMPFLALGENADEIFAAEMDGTVLKYTRVPSQTDQWEVTFAGNPDMDGAKGTVLGRNKLQKANENGADVYRLRASDGSVREFVVRSFTIGGITRTRPYLRRWTDHAGNYYDFEFFDTPQKIHHGQLRYIRSSSGPYMGFYYDATGHVSEIYAGDGRRVRYKYNDFGDLVEVVRPDNSVVKFEYAMQMESPAGQPARLVSTHLLTKEILPDGRVIVSDYEKQSAPNDHLHADTRRVLRQYSNVGRVDGTPVGEPVDAADSNDPAEESYEPRLMAAFDYSGLVKVNAAGTPDVDGKYLSGPVEISDAYGRTTLYHYELSRLVRVARPVLAGQAAGHTSTTEYYGDDDTDTGEFPRAVKRTVDERGLTTEYLYDSRGNTTSVTVSGDLDGDGTADDSATTTMTYTTSGVLDLPLVITAPDKATGAATGPTTEFVYGSAEYPRLPTQVLKKVGSAVISKTVNTYISSGTMEVPFARGLVASTSTGMDGDMALTTCSYNRSGQCVTQTKFSGVSGVPDLTTQFRYNARNELLQVTDAAGRSTRYAYDDMGRRIWEERLDESGVQVGWNYVYYTQNGDVEWTDGPRFAPEDFTFTRYDGMGRVVEQVGWRSQAKADGSGVEEVPGIAMYATVKKKYNLFGDLIKVMDPRGNTVRMKYDVLGRMTERSTYEGDWEVGSPTPLSIETTAYGAATKAGDTAYLAPTNTVSTSATGGVTTTQYTTSGKPLQVTRPDGTVLTWEYYLDGRVKKEPVTSTTWALYTYDDDLRKVSKVLTDSAPFAGSGNVLGQPQTAIANSRGQVVQATDTAGAIVASTYDKLARPLTTTQPYWSSDTPKLAVGHIYDAAGIVATSYNAYGEKSVTTHDALGRPVTVQVLQSDNSVLRQSSLSYSQDGNRVTTTTGTGGDAVSTEIYTDTAGRTVLAKASSTNYSLIRYDATGNTVSSTTVGNLDGVAGSETLASTTTYDALGRPLVATMPDGAQTIMEYAYLGTVSSPTGFQVKRKMPGAVTERSGTPPLALGSPVAQGGLVEVQQSDSVGRSTQTWLQDASANVTRKRLFTYHTSGTDKGRLDNYQQAITDGGSPTYRTHSYAYDDWGRVDTYTCGSGGDQVVRAFTYDDRSAVTHLAETTAAGTTTVERDYDAAGRIAREQVLDGSTVLSDFENDYDDAGRRASLAAGSNAPISGLNYASATSFTWWADGAIASATAGSKTFAWSYDTAGRLSVRGNDWRSASVTGRDGRGRVSATAIVLASSSTALTESLSWTDDDKQLTYDVQHGALGGLSSTWTDPRTYEYDANSRRLKNENYIPAQGVSATAMNYQFDQNKPGGLGVRTYAVEGSWPSTPATATTYIGRVDGGDSGATNSFARVLREETNDARRPLHVQGAVDPDGADAVRLKFQSLYDVRPVNYSPTDPTGAFDSLLHLRPARANYQLDAEADYSGIGTVPSGSTNFAFARQFEQVENTYDGEGRITQRVFTVGMTVMHAQVLTWDAAGRLTHVEERDLNNNGYDWSARYDGLDRRISTTTVRVFAGTASTAADGTFTEQSWYDPLYEFLEIAVVTEHAGSGSRQIQWKVHGPDASGAYGAFNGLGGLEASVDGASGTWTAYVEDFYGHIVGLCEGAPMSATFRWQATRSTSYGPLPGAPVYSLCETVTASGEVLLGDATAWRGKRQDITGFYYLGARYYESSGGRFLSPDPLGHGSSMSLYDYAGGDPVNFVDPDGRAGQRPGFDAAFVTSSYGKYDRNDRMWLVGHIAHPSSPLSGWHRSSGGALSSGGASINFDLGKFGGALGDNAMGIVYYVDDGCGAIFCALTGGWAFKEPYQRFDHKTGMLFEKLGDDSAHLRNAVQFALLGNGTSMGHELQQIVGGDTPEQQAANLLFIAAPALLGKLSKAGPLLNKVDDVPAAKSGVWSLGPGPRGLAIESQLGGNLPAGFRVIDRFENGVATSIKSVDLNAATYQNAQALGSRLNGYVDKLAGWTGQTTPYGGVVIQPGQVTAKVLQVAVPQGSMSAAQQAVFNAAAQRAQGAGLNFIVTPVP